MHLETDMDFNDDNILRFWQWFVKNEKSIKECIENDDVKGSDYVVDQMNEHILGLGLFTWDLGLNDSKKWFLMLSPNGNPEMLKVSEKIMSVAPEHMDWLFYSSKPAKLWNRQFTIYDDYMDEQFVDASDWHFIVFEDDEGEKLELVIEAKNISHLDSDSADAAAEQFVIQEIGEDICILHISSIVVVETLDKEDQDSKISVIKMKSQLKDLLEL